MYAWTALVKGMGRAQGADSLHFGNCKGQNAAKGFGVAKDIGIFRTSTGEMETIKGSDVAKMVGDIPMSLGL